MPLIWTSAKHGFNGPSTFGLSMDISKIHSFKFLHKFAELKEYDKAGWLKLSIVDRWARSGGLSLHGCHPVLRRMVSSDGTTISLWSGVARSESAIKVVYWEVDAAVYHEEEVGYFEQSRNNLKIDKASIYISILPLFPQFPCSFLPCSAIFLCSYHSPSSPLHLWKWSRRDWGQAWESDRWGRRPQCTSLLALYTIQ